MGGRGQVSKQEYVYNLLPNEERQDNGVLNIFTEAIVCRKRNINIIDSDLG